MYKIISFCKWCQHLPLPELAKTLKEIGFDGVDLPCRPVATITPPEAPKKLPAAKRIFEDHGLEMKTLVTAITEPTPENERLLEVCAELGIRKIRVMLKCYPDANGRELIAQSRRDAEALEKLLAKHGVRGAIQNHSFSDSTLAENVSSLLLALEGRDPEWIGIQYDPGHNTLAGENPALAFQLLGPYLHSINFKSPRMEAAADPENGGLKYLETWMTLQDGMLDTPLVLRLLKESGYTGSICLNSEYRSHYCLIENSVELTNAVAKTDLDYLRKEVARL